MNSQGLRVGSSLGPKKKGITYGTKINKEQGGGWKRPHPPLFEEKRKGGNDSKGPLLTDFYLISFLRSALRGCTEKSEGERKEKKNVGQVDVAHFQKGISRMSGQPLLPKGRDQKNRHIVGIAPGGQEYAILKEIRAPF